MAAGERVDTAPLPAGAPPAASTGVAAASRAGVQNRCSASVDTFARAAWRGTVTDPAATAGIRSAAAGAEDWAEEDWAAEDWAEASGDSVASSAPTRAAPPAADQIAVRLRLCLM